MKVYYLILAVLLLLVGAYCCREWREDEVLRRGRARCERAITLQAAVLRADVLERAERVPEVTDELTGWTARLKACKAVAGDDSELQQFVKDTVEERLYNQQENVCLLSTHIAAVLAEWQTVENDLARQLKRPVVSEGAPDTGSLTVKPGEHVDVQQQLVELVAAELCAVVGAEVATAVGTRLAVSGGILATSSAMSVQTVGISLVVGLVADWVVGKVMDPRPELEKQLKQQLEDVAGRQEAQFREIMLKLLDECEREWRSQNVL